MTSKPAAACLALTLALFTAAASLARAQQPEANARITHATLELADGTRLSGIPTMEALPATLSFAEAAIPLSDLRRCEFNHQTNFAVLVFNNGDRLTAKLKLRDFALKTPRGPLSPQVTQIQSIAFAAYGVGELPPGDGDLTFGGVNWQAWRTSFERIDDMLVSMPQARPGFSYGHGGNGRGPLLATNIGSSEWKDYSLEFNFCVMGVDQNFNPYALGADYHDGAIMFHVADAKESFNERGTSAYILGIHGDGSWDLRCTYNDFCDQPIGWGNPKNDGQRQLASGNGLTIDRELGNKFRIDVTEKRIQIWVDNKQIVDQIDDAMPKTLGGQTLDHGGVIFIGGFEAMFWLKNFSAQPLR